MLHQEQRRLAMMNAGQHGFPVLHFLVVDLLGQRFAARLATDPPGILSFRETVAVEGEASQETTLRWEDYASTAMDPSDDCTFWYVGDYLKSKATAYSTRIAAVRFPGCIGR